MKQLLAILLLISCGVKQPLPSNTHDKIDINYSYKLDENDGDYMLRAGQMCFAHNVYYCSQIKSLQDSSGRIWRSKSRIGIEVLNTSSRDMLLGFLMYVQETRDIAALDRLISYIKDNNFQLCPSSSDNRCFVTPQMYDLMRLLKGKKTIFNSYVIEALTSDTGYTLYLIGLKLLIHIRADNWYSGFQETVEILYEREKCNPLFAYLAGAKVNFRKPVESDRWLMEKSCEEAAEYDSASWSFLKEFIQ